MAKKVEKTNVMRVLDQHKIEYRAYTFDTAAAVSGVEAAAIMGKPVEQVFKTLVTVGAGKAYYVFVIPAACELNLKAAAKAVGEKSIEMLPSKQLLALTGYVHGGCSPIGMKKLFQTVLDSSAENLDTIIFSAGKIGYQVEVKPQNLAKIVPLEFCKVTS